MTSSHSIPYASSSTAHPAPPPTPSHRSSHRSERSETSQQQAAPPSSSSLADADVRMATYKPPPGSAADVRMQTAARGQAGQEYLEDVRMMTSRGTVGGAGLKPWERELAESQEVKRKATVAQLCESDLPSCSHRLLRLNTTANLPCFSLRLQTSSTTTVRPSPLPLPCSSI
jgi:hypothetical protein